MKTFFLFCILSAFRTRTSKRCFFFYLSIYLQKLKNTYFTLQLNIARFFCICTSCFLLFTKKFTNRQVIQFSSAPVWHSHNLVTLKNKDLFFQKPKMQTLVSIILLCILIQGLQILDLPWTQNILNVPLRAWIYICVIKIW